MDFKIGLVSLLVLDMKEAMVGSLDLWSGW